MYTDKLNTVATAQVVTATAVSTDVIDLAPLAARDIGEGKKLIMAITCSAGAAAVGAATVEFQILGSPNSDLSAPTVIGSSGAIGKAALPTGQIVYVDFNSLYASTGYRYVGVNYVVTTGPLTAGTFSAGIVETVQDGRKFYTSGFTIV